jgi:hypothetical protein
MCARTARYVVHAIFAPLFLVAGACTQWKVQRLSPADLVSQEQPDRIQVTRRTALSETTKVVLYHPAVLGDTLVGVMQRGMREDTLAIPVADVVTVAVRRFDSGKTILLGVGVVGLIAIMAVEYNATDYINIVLPNARQR